MGSQPKDKSYKERKIDLDIIRRIVGDEVDCSEADRILEEERKRREDRDKAYTIEIVEDDCLFTFD